MKDEAGEHGHPDAGQRDNRINQRELASPQRQNHHQTEHSIERIAPTSGRLVASAIGSSLVTWFTPIFIRICAAALISVQEEIMMTARRRAANAFPESGMTFVSNFNLDTE
jgi:hypothetical protein